MSFWNWTKIFRRQRATHDFLSAPETFQWILERERMRADRSGGTFTLLLFRRDALDGPAIDRLAGILEGRLRATDYAGLTADGGVGVLLPDTPTEGAQVVLRDIYSLYGDHDGKPPAELRVYPSGYPEVLRNERTPARTPEPQPAQHLFVRQLPRWKRLIDIIGSGAALVLSLPVLFLAAVAIRLTSPGPVLFSQLRSGIGGHPFWMYKFRTMCTNAEELKANLMHLNERDGPAFKVKNDPRITRVGRILRASCIDEFPQFWNVLKGDMTLVGPRPLPCDESNRCENWQKRRLDITPGLTCIWQVRGLHTVEFSEWMRMDLRYARSRSLWRDLLLIGRTGMAVVMHRASH